MRMAARDGPVQLRTKRSKREQPMPLPRLRPISATLLVISTCAFIMLTANATHFRHGLRIFDGALPRFLVLELALFLLLLSVVMPFTQRWIIKPVLVFLLLTAAAASHFLQTYGTVVDREMIQNVMETTSTEASHLMTFGLLRDMILFGLLPAALVILTPLKREAFWGKLGRNTAVGVLSLGLCLGLLLTDYARYAAIFREQKELMATWNPGAPIAGAVRYARLMMRSRNVEVAKIGTDARPGEFLSQPGKPVLAVIVVGETGRAANWSLNGYGRDTNPELAKRDITYYRDVTSCGTSTAVSVPCMFSALPREDYSYNKGLAQENLIDVLGHAGFRTLWWDNNTGSQKVARRIAETTFDKSKDPVACAQGECDDRVLVKRLQQELPAITGNTAIVLHTVGSHGPSYYLRYDPATAPFKPACNTGELGKCTPEEIVNVYDNTIAFTDRVLAEMIDTLARAQNVVPVLIYVSDHGESLGENGLYLHAAPWFMAPEVQTHVPMLTWVSPEAGPRLGLTKDCLDPRRDEALSHDNLFSTVLGMLDIQTSVRDPALDLTRGCRPRLTSR